MNSQLNWLQVFDIQARINLTIGANNFIKRLKRLPLVGGLVPQGAFAKPNLKQALRFPALFFKGIYKVFGVSLYLFTLYYLACVATVVQVVEKGYLKHFIHPFRTISLASENLASVTGSFVALWLILTCIKAVIEDKIFPTTNENVNYLIYYLRVPAKRFLLLRFFGIILANFVLQLITCFVVVKLTGMQIPPLAIILICTIYLSVHLLKSGVKLCFYSDLHFITKKHKWALVPMIILSGLFSATFMLIVTGVITLEVSTVVVIALIFGVLALPAIWQVASFRQYYPAYVILKRKLDTAIMEAGTLEEISDKSIISKLKAVRRYDYDPLRAVDLQKIWFRRFLRTLAKKHAMPWLLSAIIIAVSFILPKIEETDLSKFLNQLALNYIVIFASQFKFAEYFKLLEKTFDSHFVNFSIYDDLKIRRSLYWRRLLELIILEAPALLTIHVFLFQFLRAQEESWTMQYSVQLLASAFFASYITLRLLAYQQFVLRQSKSKRIDRYRKIANIALAIYLGLGGAALLRFCRPLLAIQIASVILFVVTGLTLAFAMYKRQKPGSIKQRQNIAELI